MKILTREEIVQIRDKAGKEGKSVGFTSGVFDLLHRGHVEYLEKAKTKCEILIVAVNSDSAVSRNKGVFRPIVHDADRAAVVAGLAAVDYVFIFHELNNRENIALIKPDLYIKAGGYKTEDLTSAPLVEQYGGKVIIIDQSQGFSSTDIIDRIKTRLITAPPEKIARSPRPAVFLDRDGTLIEHVEYLHEPAKVKILPGVIEGLKKLVEAGYLLIIVTNQPGIGLGYFPIESFFAVNTALFRSFSKNGIMFDKVYFSPYSASDKSLCRKPNPHFVERAVEDLAVDLKRSAMIGDMTGDMEFAKRAGIKGVLVASGRGGSDGVFPAKGDFQAKNFLEAAEWILTN
jgi:rfaE bifunctional protein nucleotidyltransferase chain/domain